MLRAYRNIMDKLQLEPLRDDEAVEQCRAPLQAVRKRIGFVPNLQGLMAHSPAALNTYTYGNQLLAASTLSALERSVIFLTASVENECAYCVAAHSAGSPLDAAGLAAVRGDQAVSEHPRLEALRMFTKAVVSQRGRLETHQLDAFLEAGYRQEQVLDVLTAIALKTLTNYASHLTAPVIDVAFRKFEWSPVDAG